MTEGMNTEGLRIVLMNFYAQNDPVKLQKGFDINGVVEWAMKNGLNRLNAVLLKKYGKVVDPKEALNASQVIQRVSRVIHPELFPQPVPVGNEIVQERRRIRRKLEKFYKKHNEDLLEPESREQFDRLVQFCMYHGIAMLNKKLRKRYNATISEEDTESEIGADLVTQTYQALNGPEPDAEITYAVNKSDIDLKKLEDDLEAFFLKIDAPGQLQIIDQVADWVLRMGFSDFNEKSEQLYGARFDDILLELKKEPYGDEARAVWEKLMEEEKRKREQKLEAELSEKEALRQATISQWMNMAEDMGDFEDQLETKNFDDMTDDDIADELRAFYAEHDPDNLDKIDELVVLARKLGRDKLNELLSELYADGLRKDKMYDQDGDEGGDMPNPDKKVDAMNYFKQQASLVEESIPKKSKVAPEASTKFEQVPIEEPEELPPPIPPTKVKKSLEPVKLEPVSLEPPPEIEEKPEPISKEVQKKFSLKRVILASGKSFGGWQSQARKIGKRWKNNEARVRLRDKEGYEVATLLLEACDRYVLDPLTGACATCGLQKKYHSVQAKRVINDGDEKPELNSVQEKIKKMNAKGGGALKLHKHLPHKGLLNKLKDAEAGKGDQSLLLLASVNQRGKWAAVSRI